MRCLLKERQRWMEGVCTACSGSALSDMWSLFAVQSPLLPRPRTGIGRESVTDTDPRERKRESVFSRESELSRSH